MKANLNNESKEILADLKNRVKQLMEVNELHKSKHSEVEDKMIDDQNTALKSVIELIKQIENTGAIYRGNEYVPDAIEPLATTKWNPQAKLI